MVGGAPLGGVRCPHRRHVASALPRTLGTRASGSSADRGHNSRFRHGDPLRTAGLACRYPPGTTRLFRLVETESSPEHLAEELLALTKMNWNQTQLDARMPITLRTADRVGEILASPQPSGPASGALCLLHVGASHGGTAFSCPGFLHFAVGGMTCGSCAVRVQRVLGRRPA